MSNNKEMGLPRVIKIEGIGPIGLKMTLEAELSPSPVPEDGQEKERYVIKPTPFDLRDCLKRLGIERGFGNEK